MNPNIRGALRCALIVALISTPLAGCVVAAPPPVVQPSTYDRAFSAIVGAMGDENVRIVSEDRATGVVTGSKGGIGLTATVQPQPNGSAKIDFKTRGKIEEDPKLIDRIAAAYNARMGR